ncbi:MAG: PspC domain-containing protein [Candidatus Ornithospirochaeta sp.]
MAIRTKRWTRSPRGKVLGVATGLAEWRGFPEDITRLVVFLIFICTAFVPALIVYLLIAVILPEQTQADIIGSEDTSYSSDYVYGKRNYRSYRSSTGAEDATFREKSDSDLEKEYEELKKKVEKMENDVFDKEKEWDARFKDETKEN